MPRKRTRPSKSPSDCGFSEKGSSKRLHSDSISPIHHTQEGSVDRYPLRVYIVSAKISPDELDNLVRIVEVHAAEYANKGNTQTLELTTNTEHAHVIVTAVHTKPRLERHVSWEVAKMKTIVTPDWLRDSLDSGTIQPYGKYAALGHIRDEPENRSIKVETHPLSTPDMLPNHHGEYLLSEDPEDTNLAALDYLSNFSCKRASRLMCPNQALIEELDIIRRARFYEGEERSMLSYARGISAIKAYPCHFDEQVSKEDIEKLPYLGTKLSAMVKEYVETGKISEAQSLSSSARFLSLSAFSNIHGIGPHTARHLYSLGLRTIEDLEKYYEVIPGITHEDALSDFEKNPNKEMDAEKSIQIALILRHDLSQKIPRQEVEEINQVIVRELDSIAPGYKSMIVGGYRRGKLESNDVDIVITHTDWESGADKVKGLCKQLVARLYERGLVKHLLYMSGHHRPHNVFRTHHWDSLEKALTVFVLPYESARKRTYRRVDLIFATPSVFWTAVVGWTGSTMFERDLRLWAKQKKGLKFDSSGITRRHDSKSFFPKSEREVFDLMGLAYIPPTLRNADL